jgi:hypothetical protein
LDTSAATVLPAIASVVPTKDIRLETIFFSTMATRTGTGDETLLLPVSPAREVEHEISSIDPKSNKYLKLVISQCH